MPPTVVPIIARINAEILQHHRWVPHMLRYGFHAVFKLLIPFCTPVVIFNMFGWIAFCIPELEGRARQILAIIYFVSLTAMAPMYCGAAFVQSRCCATNYSIIRLLRQRVQPLVEEANQTLVAEGIRLHLDVVDRSRDVSDPNSSGSNWVFEMESSLVVCAVDAAGAVGWAAGACPSALGGASADAARVRLLLPPSPVWQPHQPRESPQREASALLQHVVEGLPIGTIVADVPAHGPSPAPPLLEMVETFRRELGAGGETFSEVVDGACKILGLKPSGTLVEDAKKAYDRLIG